MTKTYSPKGLVSMDVEATSITALLNKLYTNTIVITEVTNVLPVPTFTTEESAEGSSSVLTIEWKNGDKVVASIIMTTKDMNMPSSSLKKIYDCYKKALDETNKEWAKIQAKKDKKASK